MGLKNAESTFARMIEKALASQQERNISVYMDDIVVKSKQANNYIVGLEETFANLRRAEIKLNPEKCIFGVKVGKVLGYLSFAKRN